MTRRSLLRAAAAVVSLACVSAWVHATPRAQSGIGSPAYNELGQFHDKRAEDLFTQARIAISGGPGGIARLQSLRFRGRSKVPAGDGRMLDADVEIRIQLPDRYLRIDTEQFGRRLSGYAGATPLSLIEDSDKRVLSEPKDASTLIAARFELARFMLGAATWISHEVKVKLYTRDTPVDIPGPTDPLGVDAASSDDNGFSARVIMDAKSRMPARVVYANGAQTMTMTIVERKASGGYKLPSHIVTTAGERIVDDMTFDDIAVNPKFAKTDFAK